MDKRLLQTYSVWAKENLEKQIEVSLKTLGINGDQDIKRAKKVGDYTVIEGDSNSYPADLLFKRDQIVSMVKEKGYRNVIEEFAYTWFNRFVALRFMEVHDFLPHGFRVLSNRSGGVEPEILKNLSFVKNELSLDMAYCSALKEQGKTEELFRYVLLRQCNVLADILPMLFTREGDYLELLLPKSLLIGETVITKLVEIPEDNFLNDVEIVGWMYQFYISVKKDEVFASKKTITKDTLPAVTQLFTPDWIVRYMAENSVGRIWMESYPQSPLRSEMKYYVDDPEQMTEVQRKLDAIKYKNVNPEDIRVIEPCCGSGHILVYVFDLLYRMYEEKGYSNRDIPSFIFKNNIVGLDVDKRASQLAAFSLVMKARSVNPRFFNNTYYTEPRVYELQDSHRLESLGYSQRMKEIGMFSDEEMKAVEALVDTFRNGKTIGSLIKVRPLNYDAIESVISKLKKVVATIFNLDFVSEGTGLLKALMTQAKALSAKYDVMITNPPYIGISNMEASVKDYAIKHYPNSKSDMFAMFMETGFVKHNGFTAMINMHGWMFLSSFVKLRETLVQEKEIVTMAHLGARAFETIAGEVVQTTSFILRSCFIGGLGVYSRLIDAENQQKKETMFLGHFNDYKANQIEYARIPGTPIAYWVSNPLIDAFSSGKALGELAFPCQGMATTNNDRFLRLWFEVPLEGINFTATNEDETEMWKWFPYNKGGEYRKWYGNNEYIINFQNHGKEVCDYIDSHSSVNHKGRVINRDKYFKKNFTWGALASTLSCRFSPIGFIFDTKGSSCFSNDETKLLYYLGLMNSKVAESILEVLAPTLDFNCGTIAKVPVIESRSHFDEVNELVNSEIEEAQIDWDSFETSWDFKHHPLIYDPKLKEEYRDSQWAKDRIEKCSSLTWLYQGWESECRNRFNTLKANEEELNRIFIDIYGLQEELTPEVEDKDVTVRLADKERDVKSLISYLIGIIMGRYSLDVNGLAYAGGNWDASKYIAYQPDDDGIVPIYTTLGMEDSLTSRVIELIKLIYGADYYRQNIDFIAEALGKNNNESSEETLNRYLNDGFYADHLKIYQKRPIYWMFSSGKYSGFKCLVYMHRYTEDTLALINGKYFLPESTRLKNDMEDLNNRINSAEGRDKIRLEKERQKLAASYNEAIEYGQVLDHMANKYIAIDLDDGVKVNYAKFQGVELVTDSGTKVKKDLLVPIK